MKLQNQSMIAFSMNRYQRNNTQMEKTLGKLSTGLDIRSAADNPAGQAISETMRAQVRGLSQAQRNMQDGLSVLSAADEGLNFVNGLLQRARELSLMASNDTITNEDRIAAQLEMDQIMAGIDDTAEKLEFNTKKILGERAPLLLMVGSNPGQQLKIDLVDTSTKELFGATPVSIGTTGDARNAIARIDAAIEKTTNNSTKIGSYYEALEHHMKNTLVHETNVTSSLSSLEDTDMAKEMMRFISTSIRQNGDHLLVSQVNRNAQDVMKLLS